MVCKIGLEDVRVKVLDGETGNIFYGFGTLVGTVKYSERYKSADMYIACAKENAKKNLERMKTKLTPDVYALFEATARAVIVGRFDTELKEEYKTGSNPKIVMDDGTVIYGDECCWQEIHEGEEGFEKRIIDVPPPVEIAPPETPKPKTMECPLCETRILDDGSRQAIIGRVAHFKRRHNLDCTHMLTEEERRMIEQ